MLMHCSPRHVHLHRYSPSVSQFLNEEVLSPTPLAAILPEEIRGDGISYFLPWASLTQERLCSHFEERCQRVRMPYHHLHRSSLPPLVSGGEGSVPPIFGSNMFGDDSNHEEHVGKPIKKRTEAAAVNTPMGFSTGS